MNPTLSVPQEENLQRQDHPAATAMKDQNKGAVLGLDFTDMN